MPLRNGAQTKSGALSMQQYLQYRRYPTSRKSLREGSQPRLETEAEERRSGQIGCGILARSFVGRFPPRPFFILGNALGCGGTRPYFLLRPSLAKPCLGIMPVPSP